MKQIDKLILCSPYKEPHIHWKYDLPTQEFFQAEGRRPAGYTIASAQNMGEFIELPLVNLIRSRLTEWKQNNRPGLTGVTRELLEYWEDPKERHLPFFFCQIEAWSY